jgi:predicted GNAT superfamily acetyltransferase
VTAAWELAHAAARAAGVTLHPLSSVEDARAIDRVIEATWGGQHLDHEVIRALAFSGNAPWGALDDDGRLVGYVLGWAGVDADGLHVHSHMLAALPDRRHSGVGYSLKLAQRAHALGQGIHVVRWTFDPLVARNAWFNVGKLGAVADRFERNFYAEMTDDINAGERSDRFAVRWDLDHDPGPRVVAAPADQGANLKRSRTEPPTPMLAGASHDDVAILEIPAEYHDLRAAEPELGSRWRDAFAEAAEACLERGLQAVGFDRERSAYVFARPDAVR